MGVEFLADRRAAAAAHLHRIEQFGSKRSLQEHLLGGRDRVQLAHSIATAQRCAARAPAGEVARPGVVHE